MAPTENSTAVTTNTPTIKTEDRQQSTNFRSQYHKLHKSTSEARTVANLRNRFEKQVKPETNNNQNSKIPLVVKEQNEKKHEAISKEEVTQDKTSNKIEEKPPEENSIETNKETRLRNKTNETKPKKRVSFSSDLSSPPPVPKPRLSLQIQQVTIEAKVIKPERSSIVETVILNEPPTPDWDKIEFADPEERHNIIRNDAKSGSVEHIQKALDSFTMDTKKQKRSPSFRSKLMTIFSKDKDKDKKTKDKDDNKKTKKTENAVFADNAQNENFNRHSTQRHTIDTPRRDTKREINHQQFNDEMHPDQKDIEQRYAAMHIQNFNQTRNSFVNVHNQQHNQQQQQQHHQQLLRKLSQEHDAYGPHEDYVCMDSKNETKNYINVPKYDSSSTNTIESENSTTSINPLQQLQQERMAIRSQFFNDNGPPRAQTNQNMQLVNPKAAIPNSERSLAVSYQQTQISPVPSSYQTQQQTPQNDENDLADSGYGTVYERNRPMSAGSSDISATSMSSPRSPSVERTKLKLPPNREKVDLQPRLRSPIPPSEVSTDKLIATELLKVSNKKEDKSRSSPSHQKLQLEIDYPELDQTICGVNQTELSITSIHKNDVSSSTINTSGNSRETILEAGDWHKMQRDLASSPSVNSVQITTNALVHVDPSQRVTTPSQDGRSRSVTPVMMAQRNSNASLQRSPPKHEIRQTVEAFCWKELKKLKEKEDLQMQMLLSSCGYAEDPIRRSRSMAVTPRDTKRSTSLPREVRQRRSEDVDLNARRTAQQQRFNSGPQRHPGQEARTRPIFNRGSLTQQNAIEQPIYNKKVSFRSQNIQNSAWPTKNGFTQSPPQRRLEGEVDNNRESLEDDVFVAPNQQQSPNPAPPSRDEIFLLNQQRQKELLLAKAQRSNAPISAVDGGSIADNSSIISDVPPMRNIREPIYGARPTVIHPVGKPGNDSVYGTRNNPDLPGRVINEPIYGTKNSLSRPNEVIYGPRNLSPNGYNLQNGSRGNESHYGTRPYPSDSPYVLSRSGPPGSTNESPYGLRVHSQTEESAYGLKPVLVSQEPIYGRRPPLAREPIYGSRQIHPSSPESPYGQNLATHNVAQRYLPGYPPPGYQESYGPRVNPTIGEPVYGYRVANGSVRAESPYGTRPPAMAGQQQFYNRPRLPPANVGPPLPPGHPSRGNTPLGLRRSNSLRQAESPESMYSGRPNFNKPPSGAQFRPRVNIPNDSSPSNLRNQDTQGRYDVPPPDFSQANPSQMQHIPNEPIYGRKINTVSNKVCDIYGNIYEAGKVPNVPMSPPPLQKAGVLYGQLQRNSNAPPMVYQSHQQLQPTNFQRGTRLTASVNDMYRYNSNVNVTPVQRTEPPTRPLPPIPDEQQQQQKKSRFGFGRKKAENKGK